MSNAAPIGTLPTVFTKADAARRGYSDRQIRRRVALGNWVCLRRGVYCSRESAARRDADRQFAQLVRIAAAISAHHGPSWASHASARRLHRLPTLTSEPAEVTLTVLPAQQGDERLGGVRVLAAAVPAQDRTYVGAMPTLSGPRTVVDTLRTLALDDALVTGDAAIRTGLAAPTEIQRVLTTCTGWPGIVQARTFAAHLDGRRETPLESQSAAFFLHHHIPMPEPQVDIHDTNGHLIGRVDFLWRALRLIGEADGKTKYVDDLNPTTRRDERLWLERLRHDQLHDEEYDIARWTHPDLYQRPTATRDRILRALERARRR